MTDEARFDAVVAAVHAARQERDLPPVVFGIPEAAGFCAALDAALGLPFPNQPQPSQEVMQHSDPHSRQHNAPAPAVSSAGADPPVMVTHSYSAAEIIEAMAQALCCGDKACQEGHSGCFVVEADKAEARAAYLVALRLGREATERQITAAAQELYGRETVTKEWARRMVAAATDARIAEVEEMP
jgi:hypothetical protein